MVVHIRIGCLFCRETHSTKITVPEDWHVHTSYPNIIAEEEGLCPRHSSIRAFFEKVCPGCMDGTFPECGLGRSFQQKQMTLTDDNMMKIKDGFCSFRKGQGKPQAYYVEAQELARAISNFREQFGENPDSFETE